MSKFFNSLAPGRSECDSKNVIFNLVLLIGIFRSSHDNALWWMPQDLTDDKSTLIKVMAWCCQATSHYLSQCWLSSLSPYGVARPQWVSIWFVTIWMKQNGVMASDLSCVWVNKPIFLCSSYLKFFIFNLSPPPPRETLNKIFSKLFLSRF